MSSAKEVILENIRNALGHDTAGEEPLAFRPDRDYQIKDARSREEITALFEERISEYKTVVAYAEENNIKEIIAEHCKRESAERVVVPGGFPESWIPDSVKRLSDEKDSPLSVNEIDQADGVLTTCAVAIARTGTIALNSKAGQGRRMVTLVPDFHICVVSEEQIVEGVPQGIRFFENGVKEEQYPVTLISGPSATSDIELSRVEGVHGPRRLTVIILKKDQ